MGILMGLILPAGFILLVNALNSKLRSVQDIERASILPVAGISPHSKYENNLVVLENQSLRYRSISWLAF